MHIERIATSHRLAEVAHRWNEVAGPTPFTTWEWLGNWWSFYGGDGELYVLAAWEEEQLLGIAPLMLRERPARGRCLELLGTGEVCSDYLNILASEPRRSEVIAAFADWLARAEGDDRWDLLYLEGESSPVAGFAPLVAALAEHGSRCHTKPLFNTWRLELPATWEDYVALQSKSHRKQLRRLERRVFDEGAARLHTITDVADLNAGWDILVDLHQRRRQSLDQPGCFAGETFSGFLWEATSELMRAGKCRLLWLDHQGTPIAAELHFTADGVAYAYQAGVDPGALQLEPGRLITMAAIRQAIEEGFTAIDFLRGDEPYKAHFRAEPRPMIAWRVAAPRVAAHMRQGVLVAGDNLKHLVRGTLNMVGLR